MYKLVAILVLSFMIVGCASVPPTPEFSLAPGAKIGVVTNFGGQVYHSHVGTTIFNNFDKVYPYDWDLNSYAFEKIENQMTGLGYSAIKLGSDEVSLGDVDRLIVAKDGAWTVGSEKSAVLNRLRSEFDLDAVIVLKEQPVIAQSYCTQFGCTYFYINGVGLFTRSVLGMKRYFGLASFSTSVYLLNPVADLAKGDETIKQLWINRSEPLSDFTAPVDFKNIAEPELQRVRQSVEAKISQTADAIGLLL